MWRLNVDVMCSRIERLKGERHGLLQELAEAGPIYDQATAKVKEWTEKAGNVQKMTLMIDSYKRAWESKKGELSRAKARLEDLRRNGGSYDNAKEKMKTFFKAHEGLEKLVNDLIS
jgi:hypothetical protein